MPEILQRCNAGHPCEEVSARLVAADKIEYAQGDVTAAAQLRAAAARWAYAHHHGSLPIGDTLEETG